MNKQELIKRISELPYSEGPIADIVTVNRNWILGSIEQLDKPQEVPVPQFVADWYEECKENLEYNIWSYIYNWETKEKCDFKNWLDLGRNNPIQTLINMHQFGYTVEKEPKYTVKIKGKIGENLLVYGWGIKRYFFARTYNDSSKRGEHTRKELEEDGFGWVFDCPGMEIEEVE